MARSASAAHAALGSGCSPATSAGSRPWASAASAEGSPGSSVGGVSPRRLMPGMRSAALRLTGRQQVLAGLLDALGHAGLAGLEVAARVVGLLVAHLAVDLEDAVVVAEHVPR